MMAFSVLFITWLCMHVPSHSGRMQPLCSPLELLYIAIANSTDWC